MTEPPASNIFGIPWLSLAGFFGGGTFATVLVALIRAWPGLRKTAAESDASLRADLMAMIGKLEANAIEERRDCDRRLAAMQAKLDTMQEKVDGLIRQLLQYQVTTGHALPIAIRSEPIEHALRTLSDINGGKTP